MFPKYNGSKTYRRVTEQAIKIVEGELTRKCYFPSGIRLTLFLEKNVLGSYLFNFVPVGRYHFNITLAAACIFFNAHTAWFIF